MRAGFGVLVATAWLGLAGVSVASAQTAPPAPTQVLEGCGATCRFFQNLTAPAPAPEPQAEATPEAEPEAERPRRSRRNAVRRAPTPAEEPAPIDQSAEERRPRAKPVEAARVKASPPARRAPADIEQTAAIPQVPPEVRFVARPDDSHRAIGGDLAGALAPDITLRAVPGRGAPVQDVLAVPGAVTVASSLSLARGPAAAEKVVYVAKLFTEELHALAAAGIGRVEDLDSKPVYLGAPDSDGYLAATTFLDARGIRVTPVAGSLADALAGVRQGRIAAAFILAPKPFAPVAELRGAKLLPLAYSPSEQDFHPAVLTAADYPGLIGEGARVETVALDAVLIAPRWRDNAPKQEALAAFATRLFERYGALAAAGRHPKWAETNLAATVDGFQRLKSAQAWVTARLKGREPPGATVAAAPGAVR